MNLFATGIGSFTPNTVYRNPNAYGDLASLQNLPRLRQYRREVFSTDEAGFRNRHAPARPFSGILLIGDSFAVGSGVSDQDSLSEQLNKLSGIPVYNGAMTERTELSFWTLFDYLQMTRGLVIWQQSERDVPPPVWIDRFTHYKAVKLGWSYFKSWRAYSPMKILTGRAIKILQNDKILPNPYRPDIIPTLNGREILFLPEEVKNYDRVRSADATFFVQLNKRLRDKGIGLLVLLVPDKYVVYHDLLVPPSGSARPLFLDLLEQRLVAVHITVLNLTHPFREQAAALLGRDKYLYWLDDTHWNALGIHEAARELARSESVLTCSCR